MRTPPGEGSEREYAVPRRAREALERSVRENKVTFLTAGAGWGKTTLAAVVLGPQRPCRVPVQPGDMPRFPARETLVVVDGFHQLSPCCAGYMRGVLRRSPPRQHLVFLSRAPMPEYLAGYGGICRLDGGDLALGEDEVLAMARERGLELTRQQGRRVVGACRGHPVLARLLLEESWGAALDQAVLERARRRLGLYLDRVVYLPLAEEVQRLLLYTALLDGFTPELAVRLTGEGWSGARLAELEGAGAPISRAGGLWHAGDGPLTAGWLRDKARAELGRMRAGEVYVQAGGWYAQAGEKERAMACYQAAGAEREAAALLGCAVRERGDGWHAARLGRGCRGLSAAEDPAQLYGLGLLDLLELDARRARARWERLRPDGDEGGKYRQVLAALLPGGALPGGRYSRLWSEAQSSGQPTLLRGVRDLSGVMSGRELEAALDGELRELLRAEWVLERGGMASELCLRLTALRQRLAGGYSRFVCTVLLIRALCVAGEWARARTLLAWTRQEAEGGAAENLEAMSCRLRLLEGGGLEDDFASGLEDGPFLLTLFRRMTEVRCRVRKGDLVGAMLLLGSALARMEDGSRPLDRMEALALSAVCLYRAGSGEWEAYLRQALGVWKRYGYTAGITGEGAAMLPLLESYRGAEREEDGWGGLLEGTIERARRYPEYLKRERTPLECLTPREATVYRLLQMNKTRAQIGALLGIQPNTVKSHKRSIDAKLRADKQSFQEEEP